MGVTKNYTVFKKASRLESQMDEFLDRISEAGLIFRQTVQVYLEEGESEEFAAKVERIDKLETRCDSLRRDIETELFERTLIPDLRADVLALLEDIDDAMDLYEDNAKRFADEIPDIPEAYHRDFSDLVDAVVECMEAAVLAARAFFRNIEVVRDHVHKVSFFETEADHVSARTIRKIFRSDLPLERKMHLRYFVSRIDDIADRAEDMADFLAIYTIKRRI